MGSLIKISSRSLMKFSRFQRFCIAVFKTDTGFCCGYAVFWWNKTWWNGAEKLMFKEKGGKAKTRDQKLQIAKNFETFFPWNEGVWEMKKLKKKSKNLFNWTGFLFLLGGLLETSSVKLCILHKLFDNYPYKNNFTS